MDERTREMQSTATGMPSSGNSACSGSAIPEGIEDENVEFSVSSPDAKVKNQRYLTPQFWYQLVPEQSLTCLGIDPLSRLEVNFPWIRDLFQRITVRLIDIILSSHASPAQASNDFLLIIFGTLGWNVNLAD
jgi:hypothetical protein